MKETEFLEAVFILFPDITTNKQLLNDWGDISTRKLIKFCNFNYTGESTYQEFYDYLEENKHLYEWWKL